MKNNFFLTLLAILSLLFFSLKSYSQSFGIGTLNPNPSTMLDISSDNKGVLFPRVALKSSKDDTTIENGNVNGLVVYNTSNLEDISEGYYYWNGKWISMTSITSFTGMSRLAFSKQSTGSSVKKYRSDQEIPGFNFSYIPIASGTLDATANIYSTLSARTVSNIPSNTLIKILVNGETVASGINCPIVINGLVSNPTMISIRIAVPVTKGVPYQFQVTATEVFAGDKNDADCSSSGTVTWGGFSANSTFAAYLIQD